jgi:hypothetical protein
LLVGGAQPLFDDLVIYPGFFVQQSHSTCTLIQLARQPASSSWLFQRSKGNRHRKQAPPHALRRRRASREVQAAGCSFSGGEAFVPCTLIGQGSRQATLCVPSASRRNLTIFEQRLNRSISGRGCLNTTLVWSASSRLLLNLHARCSLWSSIANRRGLDIDVIAFLDIGKAFGNTVDLGILLRGNLTGVDLYVR